MRGRVKYRVDEYIYTCVHIPVTLYNSDQPDFYRKLNPISHRVFQVINRGASEAPL